MSNKTVKIQIEICSNCQQHQWCTRHNEATYSTLAVEISKALQAKNNFLDIQILQVGEHKMGSFEVFANGVVLFSKLSLGYFPHVSALTARVMEYVEDYCNGKDLTRFIENNGTPVLANQIKKSVSPSPKRKPNHASNNKSPSKKADNFLIQKKQTNSKKQEDKDYFLLQEQKGEQSVPPLNIQQHKQQQEKIQSQPNNKISVKALEEQDKQPKKQEKDQVIATIKDNQTENKQQTIKQQKQKNNSVNQTVIQQKQQQKKDQSKEEQKEEEQQKHKKIQIQKKQEKAFQKLQVQLLAKEEKAEEKEQTKQSSKQHKNELQEEPKKQQKEELKGDPIQQVKQQQVLQEETNNDKKLAQEKDYDQEFQNMDSKISQPAA